VEQTGKAAPPLELLCRPLAPPLKLHFVGGVEMLGVILPIAFFSGTGLHPAEVLPQRVAYQRGTISPTPPGG
jgi:hypothetical protein